MSGSDKKTDEQVIKDLATDAPVKQLDNLGAAAKEATQRSGNDADKGDGAPTEAPSPSKKPS